MGTGYIPWGIRRHGRVSFMRHFHPTVGYPTSYVLLNLWRYGVIFIYLGPWFRIFVFIGVNVRVTGWPRKLRRTKVSKPEKPRCYPRVRTVPCFVSRISWFSILTLYPWNLKNTGPLLSVLFISGNTVPIVWDSPPPLPFLFTHTLSWLKCREP